jgi:hypothetical protein
MTLRIASYLPWHAHADVVDPELRLPQIRRTTGPELVLITPAAAPPTAVRLPLTIGADGRIDTEHVGTAFASDPWVLEALVMLSKWEFEPATVRGTSVPMTMDVLLEFASGSSGGHNRLGSE